MRRVDGLALAVVDTDRPVDDPADLLAELDAALPVALRMPDGYEHQALVRSPDIHDRFGTACWARPDGRDGLVVALRLLPGDAPAYAPQTALDLWPETAPPLDGRHPPLVGATSTTADGMAWTVSAAVVVPPASRGGLSLIVAVRADGSTGKVHVARDGRALCGPVRGHAAPAHADATCMACLGTRAWSDDLHDRLRAGRDGMHALIGPAATAAAVDYAYLAEPKPRDDVALAHGLYHRAADFPDADARDAHVAVEAVVANRHHVEPHVWDWARARIAERLAGTVASTDRYDVPTTQLGTDRGDRFEWAHPYGHLDPGERCAVVIDTLADLPGPPPRHAPLGAWTHTLTAVAATLPPDCADLADRARDLLEQLADAHLRSHHPDRRRFLAASGDAPALARPWTLLGAARLAAVAVAATRDPDVAEAVRDIALDVAVAAGDDLPADLAEWRQAEVLGRILGGADVPPSARRHADDPLQLATAP